MVRNEQITQMERDFKTGDLCMHDAIITQGDESSEDNAAVAFHCRVTTSSFRGSVSYIHPIVTLLSSGNTNYALLKIRLTVDIIRDGSTHFILLSYKLSIH
ncbi:hypothetical protein WUBG_06372 [Wuchereria bancrofti]|uniref:Uncharacterized protein n=1 Tax=Wuchereria bancrofti TaxID=6293 RepID=J9EKK6_WUCBA|nr:hypothetical protein WUBG_06372 [Wuchereria bancrofti]